MISVSPEEQVRLNETTLTDENPRERGCGTREASKVVDDSLLRAGFAQAVHSNAQLSEWRAF